MKPQCLNPARKASVKTLRRRNLYKCLKSNYKKSVIELFDLTMWVVGIFLLRAVSFKGNVRRLKGLGGEEQSKQYFWFNSNSKRNAQLMFADK